MLFSPHRSMLRADRNRLRVPLGAEPLEERRMLTLTPIGVELRANTNMTYEDVQTRPRVATAANGDFVIAWQDQNSVRVRSFAADGTPKLINGSTAEFIVNQETTSQGNTIDVAVSDNGEFMVTWYGGIDAPSPDGFYARAFDASGVPATDEFLVEELPGQNAPQIASDAAGRFVLTWYATSGVLPAPQLIEIKGEIFAPADLQETIISGTPFSVVNSAAARIDSRVGMDSEGNFAVLWLQGDQPTVEEEGLFVQRFDEDGDPIGDRIQVSVDVNIGLVDLAMNDEGAFVAVFDGRLRAYDKNGLPRSDELQSGMSTTNNLQVAMDATGDFVIFTSTDPTTSESLRIRDYNAGGIAKGPTVLIADGNGVDSSVNAAIAIAPSGQLVVTWPRQNDFNFDFYYDIYFQRVNQSAAEIKDRKIFYNQSAWDGNDTAIDPVNDNAAIAPDKTAYLPGDGLALYSNITNFSRGITGIMVDIEGAVGQITADDFSFKVGNNNAPNTWAPAPAPSAISVIPGGGVGGSDRVEITWAQGLIKNQWLEVQVLSTADTGLAAADVHFWGNKVADSGTSPPVDRFETTSTDLSQVYATIGENKPITDLRDYNRDSSVNSTDASIAIASVGSIVRINIGSGGPFAPEGAPLAVADNGGRSAVASALGRRGGGATPDSPPAFQSLAHSLSQDTAGRHHQSAVVASARHFEALTAASDAIDDSLFDFDDELCEPLLAALA